MSARNDPQLKYRVKTILSAKFKCILLMYTSFKGTITIVVTVLYCELWTYDLDNFTRIFSFGLVIEFANFRVFSRVVGFGKKREFEPPHANSTLRVRAKTCI